MALAPASFSAPVRSETVMSYQSTDPQYLEDRVLSLPALAPASCVQAAPGPTHSCLPGAWGWGVGHCHPASLPWGLQAICILQSSRQLGQTDSGRGRGLAVLLLCHLPGPFLILTLMDFLN